MPSPSLYAILQSAPSTYQDTTPNTLYTDVSCFSPIVDRRRALWHWSIWEEPQGTRPWMALSLMAFRTLSTRLLPLLR